MYAMDDSCSTDASSSIEHPTTSGGDDCVPEHAARGARRGPGDSDGSGGSQMDTGGEDAADTSSEPDDAPAKPRDNAIHTLPWQTACIEWCCRKFTVEQQKSVLLADDMGLGKTLQALMSIRKHLEVCGIPFSAARILIVTTKSTIASWNSEAARVFPSNSIYLCNGTRSVATEVALIPPNAEIVLTTYEYVTRAHALHSKNANLLFRRKWTYLVVDETHVLRNGITMAIGKTVRGGGGGRRGGGSKSSANAAKTYTYGRKPVKMFEAMCSLDALYRIALTGTPQQNRISDIISLCVFLHVPEYEDVAQWRIKCSGTSIRTNPWVNALREQIMLRRDRSVLGLGEIIIRRRMIEITPVEKLEVAKIALNIKETHEAFMHARDQNGKHRTKETADTAKELRMNILTQISYTRMLTLSPEIMRDSERAKYDKGERTRIHLLSRWEKVCSDIGRPSTVVLSVIEQLRVSLAHRACKKILVFSPYVLFNNVLIRYVKTLLTEYTGEALSFHGQLTGRQRKAMLNEFRANAACRIMFMTVQAGGVGLTITEANHVIMVGPGYNGLAEEQCISRVYRYGQTHPVRVFRITAADSTDEWIVLKQNQKKKDVDDLLQDETAIKDYGGNSANADTKLFDDKMMSDRNIRRFYDSMVRFNNTTHEYLKMSIERKEKKTREKKARKIARMSEAERAAHFEHKARRRGRRSQRDTTLRSRKLESDHVSSDEFEHPCGNGIASSSVSSSTSQADQNSSHSSAAPLVQGRYYESGKPKRDPRSNESGTPERGRRYAKTGPKTYKQRKINDMDGWLKDDNSSSSSDESSDTTTASTTASVNVQKTHRARRADGTNQATWAIAADLADARAKHERKLDTRTKHERKLHKKPIVPEQKPRTDTLVIRNLTRTLGEAEAKRKSELAAQLKAIEERRGQQNEQGMLARRQRAENVLRTLAKGPENALALDRPSAPRPSGGTTYTRPIINPNARKPAQHAPAPDHNRHPPNSFPRPSERVNPPIPAQHPAADVRMPPPPSMAFHTPSARANPPPPTQKPAANPPKHAQQPAIDPSRSLPASILAPKPGTSTHPGEASEKRSSADRVVPKTKYPLESIIAAIQKRNGTYGIDTGYRILRDRKKYTAHLQALFVSRLHSRVMTEFIRLLGTRVAHFQPHEQIVNASVTELYTDVCKLKNLDTMQTLDGARHVMDMYMRSHYERMVKEDNAWLLTPDARNDYEYNKRTIGTAVHTHADPAARAAEKHAPEQKDAPAQKRERPPDTLAADSTKKPRPADQTRPEPRRLVLTF